MKPNEPAKPGTIPLTRLSNSSKFSSRKIHYATALIIIVLGVFAMAGVTFAAHGNNNVQGHGRPGSFADIGNTKTCMGCHQRASTQQGDSADQVANDFHWTHGNSSLLKGQMKKCTYCHKTIAVQDKVTAGNNDTNDQFGPSSRMIDGTSMAGDVTDSINSKEAYSYGGMKNGLPIRRNVSPIICNRCHGVWPESQHSDRGICNDCHEQPEPDEMDEFWDEHTCKTCHQNGPGPKPTAAHNKKGPDGTTAYMRITTLADNFSYCTLCHGGQALFLTEESNYYKADGTPDPNWNP